MKIKQSLSLLVVGVVLMCACDESNNFISPSSPIDNPAVNEGVVILNTGNMYSGIEGDISRLLYCSDVTRTDTLENAQVANTVFKTINMRSLGATPNDILRYGHKIYVAVDGSNTLEIMDAGKEPYKSIKQIALAGNDSLNKPRKLTAADGYVYVSLMSGHVARIDTISLEINKVFNIGVGTCPEGLAISQNKLYVATSGDWQKGYLSTLTRIDLSTFTQDVLSCGLNPTEIKTDKDGRVYVLCMGDYASTKASIYLLGNAEPEKICEATMFDISENSSTMYAINCAWDVYPITYFSIDLTNKQQTPFNIQVTYPAGLACDPTHQYIIVTSYYMGGYGYPSYNTPGYAVVFTKEGKELTRKDVGVSPTRIVFL